MDRRSDIPARILFWLGVLFVAWSCIGKTRPPRLPSGKTSPAEFSVERAMTDLLEITRAPRPMGSSEIRRVRDYLIGRWKGMGFSPVAQEESVPDYFDVDPGSDEVTMANILARWPGTRPSGAVALMGHYDSAPTTYGANDNASAVAVILEVARLIQTGPPLENDLLFILTDGEEPAPRFGATAFVRRHPWFKDVGLVVNLDALGGTGPSTLMETGGNNFRLLREFRRAVPDPLAFSYTYDILRRIPDNPTDFGPFLRSGIPGYNLAYTQDSAIYHTRVDTADRVDPRSLRHQGANALALARHFGRLDLSAERFSGREEAVYFTLFRRLVLIYPGSWALPLALAATLMMGGLFAALGKSGRLSRPRLRRGVLIQLAAALSSTAAAGIGWWAIVAVRGGDGNPISRREAGLWAGALFLLVLGVSKGVLAIRRDRSGDADFVGGSLLWWWVLCVSTAVLLPGWSCLFLWPLVFAIAGSGLAQLGGTISTGAVRREAAAMMVVSVLIAVLTPVVVDFFHLAQPRPGNPESQMIPLVVIPALMISLSLGLVGALRKQCLGGSAAEALRRGKFDQTGEGTP